MRKWRVALVLAVAVAVLAAWWLWRRRLGEFDLLVYNGRVFDGERFLGRWTCVGIRQGRIARVGFLFGARSRRWLNAKGNVISPGFIDVHTHVERNIARGRPFRSPNFIQQGVTTLITGNCGTSRVDVRELLADLERNGSQVNVATLIGHNSIRRKVIGDAPRAAAGDELKRMSAMIENNMAGGALGISTGLAYAPGVYSTKQEVIELARAAARHGGLYVTHLRDEAIGGEAALEEALQVGREAGIPVHISHFKVAARAQWGSAKQRLERLERQRAEGFPATLDVYGYNASSTSLEPLIPPGLRGSPTWRAALKDPARKRSLITAMVGQLNRNGFPDFAHARVVYFLADRAVEGRSIADIAGPSPGDGEAGIRQQAETVLRLQARGGAQMIYFDMSEADVESILKSPLASLGSDSSVRGEELHFVHPRGLGNFPRILAHYVRERKVLTIEEALRKMTSLAADTFRLNGRGRIREGFAADLVIFSPDRIEDRATYEKPLEPPAGIHHVFVNGAAALEEGRLTGANGGQAIRRRQRSLRLAAVFN
jgi:N-acyl-D-amino-acid deacylase